MLQQAERVPDRALLPDLTVAELRDRDALDGIAAHAGRGQAHERTSMLGDAFAALALAFARYVDLRLDARGGGALRGRARPDLIGRSIARLIRAWTNGPPARAQARNRTRTHVGTRRAVRRAMFSNDLLTKCPRCQAPTAPSDDTCAACKCDLSIERQAFIQLAPAIRELRTIFAVVLVVNAIATYLMREELARWGEPTNAVTMTGAIVCGIMAALWFFAPRMPLATALAGLAIVGGNWVYQLANDQISLSISGANAIRAVILVAFVVAIRAGLTARRLRARRGLPDATLTTPAPTA
ncbi:MAG TPA: hypothetical protein VL463_00605 [Kofleriaceae bacterium]|nr:hypothetical protein [Kofleriaceae bacterium]